MTQQQKLWFDRMNPVDTINVSEVKDPDELIRSGKEYIDQTGLLVFDDNYTQVTKLNTFPKDGSIQVIIK